MQFSRDTGAKKKQFFFFLSSLSLYASTQHSHNFLISSTPPACLSSSLPWCNYTFIQPDFSRSESSSVIRIANRSVASSQTGMVQPPWCSSSSHINSSHATSAIFEPNSSICNRNRLDNPQILRAICRVCTFRRCFHENLKLEVAQHNGTGFHANHHSNTRVYTKRYSKRNWKQETPIQIWSYWPSKLILTHSQSSRYKSDPKQPNRSFTSTPSQLEPHSFLALVVTTRNCKRFRLSYSS